MVVPLELNATVAAGAIPIDAPLSPNVYVFPSIVYVPTIIAPLVPSELGFK